MKARLDKCRVLLLENEDWVVGWAGDWKEWKPGGGLRLGVAESWIRYLRSLQVGERGGLEEVEGAWGANKRKLLQVSLQTGSVH